MKLWDKTRAGDLTQAVATYVIPEVVYMGLWHDRESGGFIVQVIHGMPVHNHAINTDQIGVAMKTFELVKREVAACIITGETFSLKKVILE